MSSDKVHIDFEDSLEDTDYGFIVCGKTGKLKGIWIPEGAEEETIPDSIADLCIEFFGIDPNGEDNEPTFH